MEKKLNFIIAILLLLTGFMFYFVWNDSLDTKISQKDIDEKNFTLDKKKIIRKKEIVQSAPAKTYQSIEVKKKQQSTIGVRWPIANRGQVKQSGSGDSNSIYHIYNMGLNIPITIT